VKPQAKDARPSGLDRRASLNPLSAVVGFIAKTLVIAEFEVRKLRHDFTEVIVRAVQPALWLLLFGEVFTKVRAISAGDVPYLDFMAPGILAQSVLFVAIFTALRSSGSATWASSISSWQALLREEHWSLARRCRPASARFRKQ
jgi:ABC-2 type transport system permease protein